MGGTALADRFATACEDIADEAVAAIRREVPAVAAATTPETLRCAIVRGLDRFAQMWRDHRPVSADELEAIVAPPLELHATVDRDEALHALRVIIDVCRQRGARLLPDLVQDPAAALDFLRQSDEARQLSMRLIDALDARLHRADAGTRHGRARLDADLLDLLLDPPEAPLVAVDLAREHGIDLEGRWHVGVADAPTAERVGLDLRRLADRIGIETVIGSRGAYLVVLVRGPVGRLFPRGGPLGIATAAGTGEVRDAFDDAVAALRVARLRDDAVAFDDALLELVLLGERPPVLLSQRLLRALADPDPDRAAWLVETLEAYLDEGGSVTAAARRLNLHRESFRYRLQQLEARLDRGLDDAADRLALHIAVKAARLAAL